MDRVKSMVKKLIKKISNKESSDNNVLCNLQCILKELKCIENPYCDMKKLAKETDGFSKINGQKPPGEYF